MKSGKKKVRIYEVAKASGVSPATVSRVLNDSGYPVKEEVKEKVRKTAKELNYTPNLLGKYLKTRETKDVGVIVPNISNSYYTHLLQGIQDYLNKKEYATILCSSCNDVELERKNLNLLLQKQVKGILIASIDENNKALRMALESGIDILVMEQDADLDCDKVGFDFFRGGYLATEYLIQNGHKEIVFAGARPDRYSRKEIQRGFRACMEKYGLEWKEKMILAHYEEEDSEEFLEVRVGRTCAGKILKMEKRPTACFCMNDIVAIGLMNEMMKRGVRIPEDFSVIGFDNIEFCQLYFPRLTTIDQSGYGLGKASAKMLISRMEGADEEYMSIKLEPKLCVRDSVRNR